MGVDPLKNVPEIFPRIDFVFPAGGAEGHENRRGVSAVFTADEQPVETTNHLLPQGMLRPIVVQRDVTILQKQTQ